MYTCPFLSGSLVDGPFPLLAGLVSGDVAILRGSVLLSKLFIKPPYRWDVHSYVVFLLNFFPLFFTLRTVNVSIRGDRFTLLGWARFSWVTWQPYSFCLIKEDDGRLVTRRYRLPYNRQGDAASYYVSFLLLFPTSLPLSLVSGSRSIQNWKENDETMKRFIPVTLRRFGSLLVLGSAPVSGLRPYP